MSHIILRQPDGQWCVWSTNVDDFIIEDATREQIIKYRLERERERVKEQLDDVEEQGADYYTRGRSYEELVDWRDHVHSQEADR